MSVRRAASINFSSASGRGQNAPIENKMVSLRKKNRTGAQGGGESEMAPVLSKLYINIPLLCRECSLRKQIHKKPADNSACNE